MKKILAMASFAALLAAALLAAAPVSASAEENQHVDPDLTVVSNFDLSPGYDWSARIPFRTHWDVPVGRNTGTTQASPFASHHITRTSALLTPSFFRGMNTVNIGVQVRHMSTGGLLWSGSVTELRDGQTAILNLPAYAMDHRLELRASSNNVPVNSTGLMDLRIH